MYDQRPSENPIRMPSVMESPRSEPEACFRAFNNNHYVGLAVFIGIALDYLYRGT